MPLIVLSGLPLPPSENACYRTFMRGKVPVRAATRELKDFQREMQEWRLANLGLAQKAKELLVARFRTAQRAIRIDRYFAFRKDRLLTLGSEDKRIDAANRIKPLDDALCEHILGIDDCHFWGGYCEKVLANEGLAEQAVVVMTLQSRLSLLDLIDPPTGQDPRLVKRAQGVW